MIRKFLEALFQHKLLLMLPPLLIPGVVTPVALLAVTVILVLLLWPYRPRWPQRRPARRAGA